MNTCQQTTNYSPFIHEYIMLIAGAILGLIVAIVWDEIKILLKNRRFSKMYSKYEGIYLAFEKYSNDENNPSKYFELGRVKNVFVIKDGISISGNEDFDGQVRMGEDIYSYGSGFYKHKKEENGVVRFGFLDIQLTGNDILAHEIIFYQGKQNSDAYRWVKQHPSKKKELLNKYRKNSTGQFATNK